MAAVQERKVVGLTALWQSIATAKSLSPGSLSGSSAVHTVQLFGLCFCLLAVADPSDSVAVNAFLRVLTATACVVTGTRLDDVLPAVTFGGYVLGVCLAGSALLFVLVTVSGLDESAL